MAAETSIRRLLLEPKLRGYTLPDWYLLLRAARYLGVPPWELFDAPEIWLEWARVAENAENGAVNARAQQGK